MTVAVSGKSTCKLKGKFNLNSFKMPGDVILGGMFPIHHRVKSSNASSSTTPESVGCEGFNFRTFRWARTMIFAINEINKNNLILPDVQLGYTIYDSCFTISKAVEGTLTYLTGQDEAVPNYRCGTGAPLAVLIGAGGSALSIATARILGLYYFPQVDYSASCSVLSDKFQFPSFLRTIPNDNFQSRAMAKFVMHFGWAWVGTIASDDDYGKYGIKVFKEAVEKVGVCISFSETIPKVYARDKIVQIVETIKESTAKIIVVFSADIDLSSLIEEVIRHNISGRTWIASEAWVTSALISKREYSSLLEGTIGFGIRRADIQGLRDFLTELEPQNNSEKLVTEFWEKTFDCMWPENGFTMSKMLSSKSIESSEMDAAVRIHDIPPLSQRFCTGKEKLKDINNTYSDVSQLRLTYSVYKSVYTVAHALHNMHTCKPGSGPFVNGTCADIQKFEPWQLMYYLKNVRFTSLNGEDIYFDINGDVKAAYDIMNWRRSPDGYISYTLVGSYNESADSDQDMVIYNDSIIWNNEQITPPVSLCSESCQPGTRKGIRQGEPVCCFDCIPCADGEITNTTDARECIECLEDYWSNEKRDECLHKDIEYLGYNDPLGIALIVLSILGACVTAAVGAVYLVRRDTALVKSNDRGLSFLLLFSLVISFLSSVFFVGQPQNWSCMTRQVLLALSFSVCLSCMLAKAFALMLVARAAKAPEKTEQKAAGHLQQRVIASIFIFCHACLCLAWLLIFPPHPLKNTLSQNIKIILECSEGSVVFLCCVLGYDLLLAAICFIFAFIARKLPDNFNEAKFMTFALLVFFIVWISFIPAYLSTRGKYMVAVEIFAILASSFGMLGCLFLPKCYIILLKPERNTEELVTGKTNGNDKSAPLTSQSLSTSGVSTTCSTVALD
ncbi:vomeronasal type-2 receptor 1 [Callorhinchus milii]|uniref:vomeronasal type-2 receptor 1 n=1 Tax=Callorhinchus milii TaxID=7868 RepID=UPI0004574563|nr:vomeronasal type-2 receptor 1 [Callorhinchus milii]|eukprot:gi/632935167/ref/XP_007888074.1/ PREDICTED: vomeronasal type-2 receptor 1-like [Callorhinchus milii]